MKKKLTQIVKMAVKLNRPKNLGIFLNVSNSLFYIYLYIIYIIIYKFPILYTKLFFLYFLKVLFLFLDEFYRHIYFKFKTNLTI